MRWNLIWMKRFVSKQSGKNRLISKTICLNGIKYFLFWCKLILRMLSRLLKWTLALSCVPWSSFGKFSSSGQSHVRPKQRKSLACGPVEAKEILSAKITFPPSVLARIDFSYAGLFRSLKLLPLSFLPSLRSSFVSSRKARSRLGNPRKETLLNVLKWSLWSPILANFFGIFRGFCHGKHLTSSLHYCSSVV